MDKQAHYVRPDYEICLRTADGNDECILGFFVEEGGKVDVAIGFAGNIAPRALYTLLESGALALQSSFDWMERANGNSEFHTEKGLGVQRPD